MSQLVEVYADAYNISYALSEPLIEAISTLLQPLVDAIGVIAERFDELAIVMRKHYRFVNREGRNSMYVVPYNKIGLDALLSISQTPEDCLKMLLIAIELKEEDLLLWKDEPEKLQKGDKDLEYFLTQLSILTHANDEKGPFFTVKLQKSEYEIIL